MTNKDWEKIMDIIETSGIVKENTIVKNNGYSLLIQGKKKFVLKALAELMGHFGSDFKVKNFCVDIRQQQGQFSVN